MVNTKGLKLDTEAIRFLSVVEYSIILLKHCCKTNCEDIRIMNADISNVYKCKNHLCQMF